MTSEYLILWIDDDEERRNNKRGGVGKHNDLTVKPYSPTTVTEELLSGGDMTLDREPDLALVDWYLQDGEENYAGDGPSIEGLLRDKFPRTPIYAFSGNFGAPEFDRDQKIGQHRFAYITGPDKLDDQSLIKDIRDYHTIQQQEGRGVEGIIELLDPSSDQEQKIKSTVPSEFAEGIPEEDSGPSGSLRFAKWVRKEFLGQPGLVWNNVWTATKVGIKKDSFDKYMSELSDAKYSGIFSHRKDRWWKEEVKDIIFGRAKESGQDVNRIWKDGPELLEVSEKDKSSCEVCDDSYPPETVAAGKLGEKAIYQVHYRCSNIEKSRASTYEDLRILDSL